MIKYSLKLKVLILLMLSISLLSCSRDRIYPICFYDNVPSGDAERKKHAIELLKYIYSKDNDAILTADNRWIVAKVSGKKNDEITRVWPRLACIGVVSSGTELQKEAECVEYVSYFINNNKYLEFDLKENPIFNDESPGPSNTICYKG